MYKLSAGRVVVSFVATLLFSLNALGAVLGGVITASGGGGPLGSMTVTAYSAEGSAVGSAVTDTGGRYTLTLAAGKYRLLAFDNAGVYATSFYDNADSFSSSTEVTLTDAAPSRADFALQRAGRITGKVQNDAAASISGITVAAYNLNGTLRASTTSTAGGDYLLILAPGTYKIAAYDTTLTYALEFFSESNTFEQADAVTVSGDGVRSAVDFTLRRSANISGTVSDGSSGVVLSGLTVAAYDDAGRLMASTVTDSLGKYNLTVPPLAVRTVVSDSSGVYATAYYGQATSFEGAQRLVPSSGGSLTGIDVQVEKGGFISGIVRDAVTNAPLASMTVAAFNADGSRRVFARTDASGGYRLIVPAGTYRVAAWDDALQYVPRFFGGGSDFMSGQTLNVSAQQNVTVDLALARAAVVRGKVTTGLGSPLSGMTVEAFTIAGAGTASVQTNAGGEYVLVVPEGTYRIVAFDDALRFGKLWWGQQVAFDAAPTVTVAAGETRSNVDVRIDEVGLMRVTTLNDATGAPAAGIVVYVYDGGGFLVTSGVTNLAGLVEFHLHPLPGYHVAAFDPRYTTQFFDSSAVFAGSATISVTSSSTSAITMRLDERQRARQRPVARRP